jgi:site-specific recombinase XerD
MNNHNKGVKFPDSDVSTIDWQAMIHKCTRMRTGARDRTMLTLCYRLGLRSAEVCQLSLNSVNLDAGRFGTLTVLGKGNRLRELALDCQSSQAVRAWLAIRKSNSDWLFPTSKGESIDTSYLRRLCKRLAAAASINKRVHVHAARHTFADAFNDETNDIHVVQLALGHVSLQSTQCYLDQRKAKKRMQDAMAARA